MIRIENLSKAYHKNQVLKDVNIKLDSNKIIAILGPNGSGKTTLIKSILGLVIAQEGDVKFNDQSIVGEWEYRKQISYLPQIARFPENLKVLELIALVKDIRQQEARDNELIQYFGLENELKKPLRNLSGGTRQKVNMVLAFMFDSPVIILDEPTVGLDPVAISRFKELLEREKAKGKLIIFTTHIMSLVQEISDEIIFLLEGDIYFQGSVQDLINQNGSTKLESAITNLIENSHA
ncbi:ABC transporter ATP-binding protein [Ancylomarina salipaludis]|uniref:ABC transporter ATP-binding protein n=1 Tax=Ancylomarina salipaludis TaxID=2501299 RepID=A0A4Q1JPF0_9BACT|nr:ABC transporter ATP-binding protein [Ancylomarina salipaludis]RXQ96604.1 ABC transporter ATP-binding protein [Ancylomarina salipaludis]